MHSFPWWGELLINSIILLASWQTWVVIGGVAVGIFLWRKKNKKALDCSAETAKQLESN